MLPFISVKDTFFMSCLNYFALIVLMLTFSTKCIIVKVEIAMSLLQLLRGHLYGTYNYKS